MRRTSRYTATLGLILAVLVVAPDALDAATEWQHVPDIDYHKEPEKCSELEKALFGNQSCESNSDSYPELPDSGRQGNHTVPPNSRPREIVDALNGSPAELRIKGDRVFSVQIQALMRALNCQGGPLPRFSLNQGGLGEATGTWTSIDGPQSDGDRPSAENCSVLIEFSDDRPLLGAIELIRGLLTAHTLSLSKTEIDQMDNYLTPELRGAPLAVFPTSGHLISKDVLTFNDIHRFVLITSLRSADAGEMPLLRLTSGGGYNILVNDTPVESDRLVETVTRLLHDLAAGGAK